MFAVLILLFALTLSLLVTRVATMALMLTGLSREAARFQARSAFTGCGFTTNESEVIINHPVRRRIISSLMLLGNLGIVTVAATLMVSFVDANTNETWGLHVGLMALGLFALWLLASSRWVERRLNRAISWALRRFSNLQVRDYVAVLNLQSGYAVTELHIEPQDWLADKSLVELSLPKEGVLVLGVSRPDGVYVGAPTAATVIAAGDTLVLYGPIDRLAELDQRRAGHRGETAHQEAVSEHLDVLVEQREEGDDDQIAEPA